MIPVRRETLPIAAESDIVSVRQTVRAWSTGLGFGLVDQSKLTTAASELARNTLIYGGGGTVLVEDVRDGLRVGLRLTFHDHGPGIADVELALKDGYTTGAGLGLGLGGTKRLMHEFSITSKPNEGTQVAITHYRRG